MVSEASVLPPHPPPQLPEPTPPPQPSSRGNLSQRAKPRPRTSQAKQSPSVGYQGTSDPQRTVKDNMSEYPDLEVNQTGTSQVGAISKAQKAQNIFFGKNLKFSGKKFLSEIVAQCLKM